MNPINWLERQALRYLVKKEPEQYTWLHRAVSESPGIFWKLILFSPLATHKNSTEHKLVHLARISAMQVYDCASCLQIGVEFAKNAGISPSTLEAVLENNSELSDDELLVVRYAKSIASHSAENETLFKQIREQLGETMLVDISLAIATAAVFPTFKRGLGIATPCEYFS